MIQTVVPESVYSIDDAETCFSQCPPLDPYSAIGAGPGLGKSDATVNALKTLVKRCHSPLVLDADALNILSEHPEFLRMLPANTILTPHPGEFERLSGFAGSAFKQNQMQIAFSREYNVIVVLKGCYTSISLPDGNCFFNSTGNPGMATAGSGDVLTGILLSLLAQGYHAGEAAVIGTFLHGLAGDIAAEVTGHHALIASDIINNIGNAYITVKQHEVSDI
jgi:NAD(P)H-hydrate epimerase